MATNNIRIVDQGGLNVVPTRVFQTEANTTVINPGEPVVLTTIGTSVYAKAATDAMPVVGTDVVVGLAKSTSTQTASAAGSVEVYLALPGLVYRAKSKSAAAADTNAEILALANKRVIWDLTNGVYTVDTAAADGATNGVILTGTGDASVSEVDFMVPVTGTMLGY